MKLCIFLAWLAFGCTATPVRHDNDPYVWQRDRDRYVEWASANYWADYCPRCGYAYCRCGEPYWRHDACERWR